MEFRGTAKQYTRNGTKFGFPTANIEIDDKSLDGLFVGYTKLMRAQDQNVAKAFGDRKLPSVIFVGAPQTLNDTKHRLESYILDFPLIDLYGSEIKVEIIEKLRDNKKFGSTMDLIKQMKEDEKSARLWFDDEAKN